MPAPASPPTTRPIRACSPRLGPEDVETRVTVFAFYRDVGAVFFQGEQFIGDVPAIRLITRQISKSLDVGKLFF